MSAARTRIGSLASESRNACAVPWKPECNPGGGFSFAIAPWIASTAWPSEACAPTSNEIVTDENWPWWFTASGAGASTTWTTVESGTCTPPAAFT